MKKKLIIAVAMAAGITAIILLFSWSQKTPYSVLFANLSEGDAGKIVEKLQQLKVPYKVTANSITVPPEKVYELRLQMAAQGLPQGGGIGFEVFDKTDFQATDFVQKLNYRRALEGELARTIMALAEVEKARVHLAIPEKSLFVKDKQPPTASILLTLKPQKTLTKNQVEGIVHLVASSIEGLDSKDITIVDSNGNMLTRQGEEIMGLTATQLELQRKYEKEFEVRIREILEPVVGKEKVKVKVSTELDFSQMEKTEEKYNPEDKVVSVVRSKQTMNEESKTTTPGGVPGVQSNLPAKDTQKSTGSTQDMKKNSETVNYEMNRITSHYIAQYGSVKRLSAAVVVDGTYAMKPDSKDPKDIVYTPHTKEELKQYENLVMKAIGFNETRGDEVAVVNMPFEPLPQEDTQPGKRDYVKDSIMIIKYLAPVLLALMFILFVVRPIVKSLVQEALPQQVKELPYPKSVAALEQVVKKTLPKEPERDVPMPPTEEMTIKREMMDWSDWVKENPTQAAILIKEWMGAEEPS
ncbi:MAG: flagellar M-ring protein FliF [Nitrospirae bacterium]|nr:flagellar M-ring protein FliF [Nitrospirota bacterium]